MTYDLHTHDNTDGGQDRFVPIEAFSAAVDEVYALRTALAYEAGVIEAHLSYATFPKSRRAMGEAQVARAQAAARGDTTGYHGTSPLSMRAALKFAGADGRLTNQQWWAQWEARKGVSS